MKWLIALKTGIRARLILMIFLTSIVLMGLLSVVIQRITIDKVDEELREMSDMLLSSLDWAIAPLLAKGEIYEVQRLFDNIGAEKYVQRLRLYGPDSMILVSNVNEEVGTCEDISALEDLFSRNKLKVVEKLDLCYRAAIPVRGQFYHMDRRSDIAAVLYLEIDRQAFLHSYDDFLYATILISFIAILLLGNVIILIFSRLIVKPLQVLRNATWEVSKGNYDIRVHLIKPYEFEQFAEIFNRMTNEIATKNSQVQEYSEQLEMKVKARTRELSQSLKKLKQAQATLVSQEKLASIGRLAAGVAHEINNPIGFISSNIESLIEYKDIFKRILQETEGLKAAVDRENWEAVGRFVKEIREIEREEDIGFILQDIETLIADSARGAQRISDIVRGLQRFARDGDDEFNPEDINEALKASLKIVWNKLKYKCEVQEEYGQISQVMCDRNQLEQVFMNLLVNASDAIEEKGIIHIKTFMEKGKVVVTMRDTGSGIEADNLPHLFEPFFTTKGVGKGTGLGLSISHGIIQKHSGEILVDTVPGKGTTFRIELPEVSDG